MDFLVDIHSWYRWVVLAALLTVGVGGLMCGRQGAQWGKDSDRPFTLATILFDLQLAIGIVLWIGNKGWNQDIFIKVIHPIGMLLAAGIAHTALVRARKTETGRAYATAGAGLLVALAVVAAVVPRYAWF